MGTMSRLTKGQAAYRQFLQSTFWKELSTRKRLAVGLCEDCGSTSHLQAHHLRYPSDWYETTEDDLQVLCRGCHAQAHGIVNREELRPLTRREIFFFLSEEIRSAIRKEIDVDPKAIRVLCKLRKRLNERPVEFHYASAIYELANVKTGWKLPPLKPDEVIAWLAAQPQPTS